jgi:hypothetical protein
MRKMNKEQQRDGSKEGRPNGSAIDLSIVTLSTTNPTPTVTGLNVVLRDLKFKIYLRII